MIKIDSNQIWNKIYRCKKRSRKKKSRKKKCKSNNKQTISNKNVSMILIWKFLQVKQQVHKYEANLLEIVVVYTFLSNL